MNHIDLHDIDMLRSRQSQNDFGIPYLCVWFTVIVMSTKLLRGDSPSQHLSGGDYDGDKAFVSWDKRLTNIKPLDTRPMLGPDTWSPEPAETLDHGKGLSLTYFKR